MAVNNTSGGPKVDTVHQLRDGGVSASGDHSYKGAGANVVESSQPHGGLTKASKVGKKKGNSSGGMYK